MAHVTQTRIREIAKTTRAELIASGYGVITLETLKNHVTACLNAVELTACYEDNRRAYDAIHDTAYYRDNGCAYLKAQDVIFSQPDVNELLRDAQERRRALMMDAGTWTEKHEQCYRQYHAA